MFVCVCEEGLKGSASFIHSMCLNTLVEGVVYHGHVPALTNKQVNCFVCRQNGGSQFDCFDEMLLPLDLMLHICKQALKVHLSGDIVFYKMTCSNKYFKSFYSHIIWPNNPIIFDSEKNSLYFE